MDAKPETWLVYGYECTLKIAYTPIV